LLLIFFVPFGRKRKGKRKRKRKKRREKVTLQFGIFFGGDNVLTMVALQKSTIPFTIGTPNMKRAKFVLSSLIGIFQKN